MRLSFALSGIAASTLVAFLGWGAALFSINPEEATFFEQLLFFAPLALGLFGVASFLLLVVRKLLGGNEYATHAIGTSFREGCFITIFLFLILFLQKNHWLVWWDVLLLVVPFLLLELFFLHWAIVRRKKQEGK